MRMGFKTASRVLILCSLGLFVSPLQADEQTSTKGQVSSVSSKDKEGVYLEYLDYEGRVYSKSRKSLSGEEIKLDAAARYQYNPDTYGRFRLDIDPIDDTYESKTSKLELLLFHRAGHLSMMLDLDMLTADGDGGGISVGPDKDSEGTYISYKPLEYFTLTFFPFNFDGEVGDEFNTWDVTRIYYIDGAPNTITADQAQGEKLKSKTIPGIELKASFGRAEFYYGVGAASYLYPANASFAIDEELTADRWEWRQDVGMKAGFKWKAEGARFKVQHVRHNKSDETGSLIAQATSASLNVRLPEGPFFGLEYTHTKAGKKPYRLDRCQCWFNDTTPFYPVYSDYYGNAQDWLDQSGYASMARLGYAAGSFEPFAFYKFQSKHFIFRDPESAHRLRTADETQSHGGLKIFGLGSNFKEGNFNLRPEVEWMTAQNEVFGSSADVREDAILANNSKKNYLITLYLTYNFDEKYQQFN